jgi:hypothetical protein
MKRGLALFVPLAAAVAVALSSCGSSTTSTLAGDPVSKAAAATMKLHGARVAIDMNIEIAGQSVHMTGAGVVDTSQRKAQLDLDMSDLANLTGGDQTDPSKLHMQELLDGFILYMRAPFFESSLPHGKKWLRMDIQEVGKAEGFNLGALQQPGAGSDPSQWIQFLRSSSDIEKVGTEKVRGVETTHYKGVSHLDKLAGALPPANRKAARDTAARLKQLTGIESMPVEAWIDSEGLVRRVKVLLDYKHLPGIDQSMRMDMTEDLYDFGATVDTSPPPSDEVYDITKQAAKGIQQQGVGG